MKVNTKVMTVLMIPGNTDSIKYKELVSFYAGYKDLL